MMNRVRIALLALLLGATQAFAGAGSIGVTPGSGATIVTTTDGSGFNLSHVVTCDQSAGANCTSVKAASTAAVAGDQATVVTFSPNTGLPTGANVIGAVTQSGTWNIGTITTLPALAAGSALIGEVGDAQGGNTSGQNGPLAQGAVTTGAPTYVTAKTDPLSLDTSGNLRVLSNAGLNTSTAALALESGGNLATIAGSITATVAQDNIKQINGVTPLMGNGVTGTGSPRVTVSSDNTPFSVNAQPTPTTAGGLTTFFLQPAATTNSTSVKASAGQVYHVTATNNSATINYVRFYNTASAPTCSSATNLVYQLAIPASTSGAGFVQDISAGLAFATGIGICVSSGYATTDVTNATASAVSLTIAYK